MGLTCLRVSRSVSRNKGACRKIVEDAQLERESKINPRNLPSACHKNAPSRGRVAS